MANPKIWETWLTFKICPRKWAWVLHSWQQIPKNESTHTPLKEMLRDVIRVSAIKFTLLPVFSLPCSWWSTTKCEWLPSWYQRHCKPWRSWKYHYLYQAFNSGRTHVPGAFFTVGTTTAVYVFSDESGKTAECSFDITIIEGKGVLSDLFGPHNGPHAVWGFCYTLKWMYGWVYVWDFCNRGSAWKSYRLAPDKGFEPASWHSVVNSIKCCCQPICTFAFIHVRRTVVVGCDHAFVECNRAVRHTCGILRPDTTS